jgi:ATP-dependent Lhr-like helicase
MDGDGEVDPPLRVLWITPMRAPLIGMDIPWTLSARTGDTKSGVRAKQNKRLPTALVTTPESLAA